MVSRSARFRGSIASIVLAGWLAGCGSAGTGGDGGDANLPIDAIDAHANDVMDAAQPADVIDATRFDIVDVPIGADAVDAPMPVDTADANERDVGATDSGATDAGSADSGTTDAGSADSGATDAGAVDGGECVGASNGATCSTGECCGGVCVDVNRDVGNCGGCGATCRTPTNAAATCGGGFCGVMCLPGFGDCDGDPANGCETALNTAAHCGTCATACADPAPMCATSAGGASCASGCTGATPTRCASSMSCVDTRTDALNCGSCGNACSTAIAHATATCAASTCGFVCDAGYVSCNGACIATTSLQTDPNNCGVCAHACPAVTNATPTCAAGACGFACNTGFVACNGACVAPTGFRTDPNNCGACGVACSTSVSNAAPSCSVGACDFVCDAGFVLCNGACVAASSFQTDVNNCGSCGVVCSTSVANATRTCAAGACGFVCNTGFAACGGGCVATSSFQNDPANCGACGRSCPTPTNGTATCSNGACGFICNTGAMLCGGGCESPAQFQSDPANCGGCGIACSTTIANAMPNCTAGACGYACDSGFHSCSFMCTSNSSPASCGTGCSPCPTTANGVATCDGIACGITCNSGFHACSGTCVSKLSPSTCGTSCTPCVAPTNGTATCDGNSCGFVCNTGYHACGSICAPDNDPTHCGASCAVCTAPSGGTATCSAGTCGFTCSAGYVPSGGACTIAVPQPLWPLSGQTVTRRSPTLLWNVPPGVTGVHYEVCADRACTSLLWSEDISSNGVVVPPLLPVGTAYWRVFGRVGTVTGTVASPTWQFTVAGANSTNLMGSWGTIPDLDGDGHADLIVVGASGANVYAGSATGTPTTPSYTIGDVAWACTVDVNGDGYPDMVSVSNTDRSRIVMHAGGPGGASALGTTFDAGGPAASCETAGDVNLDGYGDVIVSSYNTGSAWVLLGAPTGLTTPPIALIATSTSAPPIRGVGDLNGDRYADIVVGDPAYSGGAGRAYVYYGSSSGLRSPIVLNTPLTGGTFGADFASGTDVNYDGYADLVALMSRNTVLVYQGGPSYVGNLPTQTIRPPFGTTSFGDTVDAAGDINSDGIGDIIVTTIGPDRVLLYLGTASMGLSLSPAYSLPLATQSGVANTAVGFGDANADGYSDVAVLGAVTTGCPGGCPIEVTVANGSASGPTSGVAIDQTGNFTREVVRR